MPVAPVFIVIKILLKQENKNGLAKKITCFFVQNGGLCTSRRLSARSSPWVRSAEMARFSRMVDTVTLGSLVGWCQFWKQRMRGTG